MNLTWILISVAVVLVAAAVLFRDRMRGKAVPAVVRPGNRLPEFSAVHEDGQPVSSADLRGRTSVLMFVRGSWCPFCSKQVQNLTKHYKEINDSGAHLILVTPKPLETTRRVADFFEPELEVDALASMVEPVRLRELERDPVRAEVDVQPPVAAEPVLLDELASALADGGAVRGVNLKGAGFDWHSADSESR